MKATIVSAAALVATVQAAAYGYPSNTTTPAYPVEPVYETTIYTEVITDCPEPTTIEVPGYTTYTVTSSTKITVCPGDCTYVITKTPQPEYPQETSKVVEHTEPTPEYPVHTPAPSAPAPVYPTGNGTLPAPSPSGTGVEPPEFTGAGHKAGISFLGAVAAAIAFL